MAGYETQDPNSLDQVQNQPGFDDQSDDESNYGGGDQSNSVGGRGGGQDQSGGDGTGTNDQSGGYSDPSQPAAAADAPDPSSGGFGTTAPGINDQSGSKPTTDDPIASQTGTGDGTVHKKHHRVEDLLGAGALGVAGYETYEHFEKKDADIYAYKRS
ncbi:hypothetical protein CY35_06G035000 [Sphagnum magellanicum]|nr:hypothetical protein CY35_06G035000 [Sphagnum magellanicum]